MILDLQNEVFEVCFEIEAVAFVYRDIFIDSAVVWFLAVYGIRFVFVIAGKVK